MALNRVNQIASHLKSSITGESSGVSTILAQSPDDVVITMAIRTPLGKSYKGAFKDMRDDELMVETYRAAIKKMGIDARLVNDICVGNVLTISNGYMARAGALAAGFPESTGVQTINRFCSSGLMSTTAIANQIRCGQTDIGLAIGVESMSFAKDEGAPVMSDEIMSHPVARDCKESMGWTSENVAGDFGITRQEMDEAAARSHQRAARAQQTGRFDDEIVPINAVVKDKNGVRTRVVVAKDDGVRADTNVEKLGKIRAAFPQWPPSQTTGGNASQITDGGAAVLMMKRSRAQELGLTIMAKYITTAVCGLAPRIMGIGPVYAIPQALLQAGISIKDVDLFEINEAFSSMLVYCIKTLQLDPEIVNVNGGAIALGHPLGCTGARQIATGLSEMKKRKQKILVTSMCIGLGQGAAAVFVNEQL